jgi:hypothetical protein
MTIRTKTLALPLATAAALMLLVGNASAKQGGVKSDFPNPTYNKGPLTKLPPPTYGGFGHHHPAPTTPTCTGVCQSSQAGGGSRVIQSRPLSNR